MVDIARGRALSRQIFLCFCSAFVVLASADCNVRSINDVSPHTRSLPFKKIVLVHKLTARASPNYKRKITLDLPCAQFREKHI